MTIRDDGVVLAIGEIDQSTATEFGDVLVRAGPTIRLDLSGVTFMDSSGLHAVLRAHQ